MTEIILGLGSNLGDREKHLRDAIDLISEELLSHVKESSIHKSAPLLLPNSPREWIQQFMNMVIVGELRDHQITPEEFLAKIKEYEVQLGRKLDSPRWSPREIDIDILAWDTQIIDLPNLKIPHPEMMTRDFVLKPLYEVYPDWLPPNEKRYKSVRSKHRKKSSLGKFEYLFIAIFIFVFILIPFISQLYDITKINSWLYYLSLE